jgi:hypothetical protein
MNVIVVNKDMKPLVEVTPGLSIGTCYTIKNESMCDKNIFCAHDSGNNRCGISMSTDMLNLFSYLLSQDIINNSNDRMYIIDGKYVPMLYLSNRLLSRNDETIINGNNLLAEIKNMRTAKYHKTLPLTDYLGKNYNTHIVSNLEYEEIKLSMERERIRSINKLSNILANISLDYLLPEHLTIATPFDSDGRINVRMTAGPCVFPYLDTSSYKLIYNCSKNEKALMTCPTLLNLDRKPVKWGYCPEDPEITKRRLNIIPTETVEGKKDSGYSAGKCIFPYRDRFNNLVYECSKDIDSKGYEFTWCPIKLKNSSDFAPVAARDLGSIWRDKWRFKSVFKPNSNKITDDFMEPIMKGYCQPPEERKKDVVEDSTGDPNPINEEVITMANYQPLNCMDTPSKGGYTKDQLYNFGKNELKIPYVYMKKGDNKLGKPQLCKIINNRFKELKYNEVKTELFYDRDIDKCLLGEKKGGYKLQELREIGVQHFGLSVEKANELRKEELCAHIVPIVKKRGEHEDIIEKIKESEDLSTVYKKNIDLCVKSKKRGGYGRKELIDIATRKLGLKITNDMLKEEICKLVKDKILSIKETKKIQQNLQLLQKKEQEQSEQREYYKYYESNTNTKKRSSSSKSGINSNLMRRIKTVKLERAKSFRDLNS